MPPIAQANSRAPWLARKDWASGIIRDSVRGQTYFLWIFTILWNAACVGALSDLARALRRGAYSHVAIAVIFPIIGIGMLLWAIVYTLRAVRFGKSVFHLQTIPCIPGHNLAGTIHVSKALNFAPPVQLRLVMVRRTRTGGSRPSYLEADAWRSAQTLDRLPRVIEGAEIPVFFQVPADARPTDQSKLAEQFIWRIEARVGVGPAKYFSQYEIPMFVTDAPAIEAPDLSASYRHHEPPTPVEKLREPGIDVMPTPDGGLQIHFAAGRNKKAAVGMCVLGVVFFFVVPIIGYCVVSDFTPILRIIILCVLGALPALIGLICLVAAAGAFMLYTQVTIHHGTMEIQKAILFIRRRLNYTQAQIASVGAVKSGDSNGIPWYAIQIKTIIDRQPISLADFIRQKDFAQHLADEIGRRMNATVAEFSEQNAFSPPETQHPKP